MRGKREEGRRNEKGGKSQTRKHLRLLFPTKTESPEDRPVRKRQGKKLGPQRGGGRAGAQGWSLWKLQGLELGGGGRWQEEAPSITSTRPALYPQGPGLREEGDTDSTWSLLLLLQDPLGYQLCPKPLNQPLGWAAQDLAETQKI